MDKHETVSVLTTIRPSGKRLPLLAVLVGLALLCCLEFATHLNINGEVVVWQAHSLGHAYGATGSNTLVNGREVRNEGLTNLINTYFFAGGRDQLALYYELSTNRLMTPFLASLLTPFTGDVVLSIFILNLLFWIAASWATFGLGLEFGDERLGLIMGVMVAASQGFLGTALGTKAHLPAYSFIIILVFLAVRLRLFEKSTPYVNYLTAGLLSGVSVFFNGLYIIFGLFVLLRGVFRVPIRKLLLVNLPPLIVLGAIKLIYKVSSAADVDIGDRTFATILSHIKVHLAAVYNHFVHGEPISFIIRNTAGAPLVHRTWWQPFAWFDAYAYNYVLLTGVPFLVLAVVGLLKPRLKAAWTALSLLLAVFAVVFLVQSYWPTRIFWGYSTYYAALGFYILAGCGILNLGSAARWTASRLGWGERARAGLDLGLMAAILGALIVFTNQDILFGRLIGLFRFHLRYDVWWPADWDFGILDW